MKKLFSILLIGVILLLSGCKMVAWDLPGGMPKGTVVLDETITSNGGTVTVSDGSVLNGLSLEIPADGYNTKTDVEISYLDFEDDSLDEGIGILTPLIIIDNGHSYSDQPMTLSIPIDVDITEKFVMAFYYNYETGEYEAITTKSYSNSEIVIFTRHFSNIVVLDYDLDELDFYSTINSRAWVQYDTGFIPGVDDWHFTNYGSEIADYGHCAGQTLTMSWYYQVQKVENSEASLNGLFDNNEHDDTPNFWIDDSDAYRFASVIQNEFDFADEDFIEYINVTGFDPQMAFYSIAFAIQVTNSPQFMAIYSQDQFGNITGGHAILAYAIHHENGYPVIRVADPNYPGDTTRYITFDRFNNWFSPYSSGANANDITTNGATTYTLIAFIGQSGLVNYDVIENEFEKVVFGSSGQGYFSDSYLEYASSYDSINSEFEYSPLTDHVLLNNDYASSMYTNKVFIRAYSSNPNALITLYNGETQVGDPKVVDAEGYAIFEVYLSPGSNDLGFHFQTLGNDGYLYYQDFIRLDVEIGDDVVLSKQDTLVGIFYEYARSDGDINSSVNFRLNADGTSRFSYAGPNGYNGGHDGVWRIIEHSDGTPDILENSHCAIGETGMECGFHYDYYEINYDTGIITRYYDDGDGNEQWIQYRK